MANLEEYWFGELGDDEEKEIEFRAVRDPKFATEVREGQDLMSMLAIQGQVKAPASSKDRFLNFLKDAPREHIPIISSDSTVEDFTEFLEGVEMPVKLDSIHVVKSEVSPSGITTACVYFVDLIPLELHRDRIEKFFILEGSCEITIGEVVHSLVPGSTLSIPPHFSHHAVVTSDFPCKAIVQRIPA